MEVQSSQEYVWQVERVFNHLIQNFEIDAELVVGGAGGDIAVGVGVDVGIYPDG